MADEHGYVAVGIGYDPGDRISVPVVTVTAMAIGGVWPIPSSPPVPWGASHPQVQQTDLPPVHAKAEPPKREYHGPIVCDFRSIKERLDQIEKGMA